MTIRKFSGISPSIASSAYVDELSAVIGDVTIGEDSSIWPMAVLRGDVNSITIGARTSIQDGTVIHVNHKAEFNPEGDPVWVGDDVTIGHQVTLHGCTIHHHCLIGIGSVIMDRVVVEPEVIVGAGTLVPPGKILQSGYLWLGNPAKKVRPLTEQEKAYFEYSAQHYVRLKDRHIAPD
jgi:carbonic anhydrase/acetyltransferase-like protein (isoleucine patch superfamily)